jgi:hypothetical protein
MVVAEAAAVCILAVAVVAVCSPAVVVEAMVAALGPGRAALRRVVVRNYSLTINSSSYKTVSRSHECPPQSIYRPSPY